MLATARVVDIVSHVGSHDSAHFADGRAAATRFQHRQPAVLEFIRHHRQQGIAPALDGHQQPYRGRFPQFIPRTVEQAVGQSQVAGFQLQRRPADQDVMNFRMLAVHAFRRRELRASLFPPAGQGVVPRRRQMNRPYHLFDRRVQWFQSLSAGDEPAGGKGFVPPDMMIGQKQQRLQVLGESLDQSPPDRGRLLRMAPLSICRGQRLVGAE